MDKCVYIGVARNIFSLVISGSLLILTLLIDVRIGVCGDWLNSMGETSGISREVESAHGNASGETPSIDTVASQADFKEATQYQQGGGYHGAEAMVMGNMGLRSGEPQYLANLPIDQPTIGDTITAGASEGGLSHANDGPTLCTICGS